MLIGVLLFVSAGVSAQTKDSSVMLRGAVSETVVLSVLPNLNLGIDGANSGSSVRLVLSGTDAGSPVVRVPLLVRSNTGFKISGVYESNTAGLSELSVVEVRATGSLASPRIVQSVKTKPQFDFDVSQPVLVLTGPRVSLGGTLQSPNNALEITLLIRVKPQPHRAWLAHLTLVASAEPQLQ
jgi:hypothetical protein